MRILKDDYPVYFEGRNTDAMQSAEIISPLVMELVQPRSVVDIGCDDGAYLVKFKDLGIEKLLGIDSPGFEQRRFFLKKEEFLSIDLRNSFSLNEKFDLAICLEVAEHLPKKRAKTFIDDLCSIAPNILFSAAVPGQGGVQHINLQWPDYWEKFFNQAGFLKLDPIRPIIWQRKEVAWYYRQNCFLYVAKELVKKQPKLINLARISKDDDMILLHEQVLQANFSITYSLKRMPGIIWTILNKIFTKIL